MNNVDLIFDWLEVWALLIPIGFMLTVKKTQPFLKPVIYYLFTALALNIIVSCIYNQRKLGWNLPWHHNVVIYNIHSIARLLFFSWFFIRLQQPFLVTIKKMLPYIFLVFVAVNFIFFED